MIHTVNKNRHRFLPPIFGLFFKKKIFYDVCFLEGSEYDIDTDQSDINKLFGVGFFPHHHVNSARFGWRYNPDKVAIELLAYFYDNGVRKSEYVGECMIGEIVRCELTIHKSYYIFGVRHRYGRYKYSFQHISPSFKRIGYKLGLYFGGNRTAPHTIKIMMK
jgi:hypothetical protein